jgi:hypothetical protein
VRLARAGPADPDGEPSRAVPRGVRHHEAVTRAVPRRRVLGVAAAAGVLGAVGGAVAAASLGGGPEDAARDDGTGRTGGQSGDRTSDQAGPGEPRAGRVLWADRATLHDGDTAVPLRLVDPPAAVQRFAGGWVVSTISDYPLDLLARQTSVVRRDGTIEFLAETVGPGDVSPDGTHYLAAATDGSYAVWDLRTDEVVDRVRGGRRASQTVQGGAQYVDADTVATSWLSRFGDAPEVLLSDLGSDERELLADDVAGEWAVSPDGRWFVGSLAVARPDRAPAEGCTVVRALDGRTPDRRDCGAAVTGVPSFLPDSSAVVAGSGDFELLPLGGDAGPRTVSGPSGSFVAVALDRQRLAVVAPADGGRTTIQVCSVGAGCDQVGRTDDGARNVVLGS